MEEKCFWKEKKMEEHVLYKECLQRGSKNNQERKNWTEHKCLMEEETQTADEDKQRCWTGHLKLKPRRGQRHVHHIGQNIKM